ncbi:MAG: hypothetical protein WBA93_01680, partial [Microcoleaceae cyanobacterium]
MYNDLSSLLPSASCLLPSCTRYLIGNDAPKTQIKILLTRAIVESKSKKWPSVILFYSSVFILIGAVEPRQVPNLDLGDR